MAVFQIIVVDTHYNGGIDSVFGRRRQDDFLGAVFQVVAIAALAAFLRTEYTCRFYHHIGSLAPFDVQRSAFSSDGDAQAVDDECRFIIFHRSGKLALGGVVFLQKESLSHMTSPMSTMYLRARHSSFLHFFG